MNTDRLLALYDRVVDAPDAVGRLRRFVLGLAVRGRLVEPHSEDEPVATVLADRGVRVSDSQAFETPATWAWVSAGTVAESRLGKMLDKSKNTGASRRYLRNVNVRWFDFDLSDVLEMRFEDAELPKFALRHGDVLICEGGEPGRAAVWDGREDDIYFQKAIHRLRFLDIVDGEYFVKALRASADDGRLVQYFTGTTIKHFTGTALRAYLFPLPPLTEQRRIVKKVDELMALCDQLAEGHTACEDRRTRLTKASYARLSASEIDSSTFQSHAPFAVDAFPALTARANQVKHLRQTVLSLAMRGKLVKQDPNDEPASELLKRIESGMGAVPVSGQKRRPVAVDSSLEATATSPAAWEYPRLAQLVRVLNGRAYRKDELLDSGTPVLRVGNLFTSKQWYHSDLQLAEDKYCDEGDLLYAWSASFGPVIWKGPRAIFHYHIWKLSLFSETELAKRFLYYFLLQHTQEIKNAGHGTTMVHMTKSKMERLPVPLPPLAEQHRIVAKLDHLMPLCDRLKAGLRNEEATRLRLLDSLIQELLTSPSNLRTQEALHALRQGTSLVGS